MLPATCASRGVLPVLVVVGPLRFPEVAARQGHNVGLGFEQDVVHIYTRSDTSKRAAVEGVKIGAQDENT